MNKWELRTYLSFIMASLWLLVAKEYHSWGHLVMAGLCYLMGTIALVVSYFDKSDT